MIDPDTGEVTTVTYWHDRIVARHGRSVEAIIAVGRELIAAKQACVPQSGEWTELRDMLPFSREMVEHYMVMARHEIITECANASILPASHDTLYALTKVDPGDLQAAIDAGRITPNLERKDIGRAIRGDTDTFDTPDPPTGLYRCVVIDPPWPMEKIGRDVRPLQTAGQLDYPTMTIDQIADAVNLADCTDPAGAHIYLWTTHRFLPTAFDLFDQWDVRYQCLMTWVKNVGPTPFTWMYDTEHVLFGNYGAGIPVEQMGLRLSFSAATQGHSIKPDIFYDRVRAASPAPRLDMFNRRDIDGFETWGRDQARGVGA